MSLTAYKAFLKMLASAPPRHSDDSKPPGCPRRAWQHARAIRARLSYCRQIIHPTH